MINKIPGWLNFLILWMFYLVLSTAVILLWHFFVGKFPELSEYVLLMTAIYAGGYLSKWREKQGGGWRFW
jgi:hypothetical protein